MPLAGDRPQPGSFEPLLAKGPTTAEAFSPKARTRSSRWLLQVSFIHSCSVRQPAPYPKVGSLDAHRGGEPKHTSQQRVLAKAMAVVAGSKRQGRGGRPKAVAPHTGKRPKPKGKAGEEVLVEGRRLMARSGKDRLGLHEAT